MSYMQKLADQTPEDALRAAGKVKGSFLSEMYRHVDHLSQRLATDPQMNVEDAIYQLIINHWYQGTMITDIYHRLHESVRREATNGTLSADSMGMIKAEIIASIGGQYFYDHFVK